MLYFYFCLVFKSLQEHIINQGFLGFFFPFLFVSAFWIIAQFIFNGVIINVVWGLLLYIRHKD